MTGIAAFGKSSWNCWIQGEAGDAEIQDMISELVLEKQPQAVHGY